MPFPPGRTPWLAVAARKRAAAERHQAEAERYIREAEKLEARGEAEGRELSKAAS